MRVDRQVVKIERSLLILNDYQSKAGSDSIIFPNS